MVMINVEDARATVEMLRRVRSRMLQTTYATPIILEDIADLQKLIDTFDTDSSVNDRAPLEVQVYGHETSQVERTVWPDYIVTARSRSRRSMTEPWGEWRKL